MLPVVARELRVTARRRGTYWMRVGASLLAMLTMLWLLIVAAAGSAVAAQGKLLFEVLSGFAFAFALLVGVRITSDCLSSEKREGTLGLLFLTDLKGYDVVFGKLASSSLASFYGLLAIVPVLALALLIGGVSLPQVFRVALVLLNTMFFSLSVGLFVSTLSQNERKAMFAAFVLITFFTLFPGVVIIFCREVLELKLSENAETFLCLPSPFVGFMQTLTMGPWSKSALPFFLPLAVVHLLSWVLLASASLLLTRVSHDRPKSARRANWSKSLRDWNYGAGETRLRFRRAMLDRNAFSWLAARDRLKPHFVWFFFGVLAAPWGWGAWKYSIFFGDWEIAPALLFLVHGFVKLWFASEVCSRLVEDRRAGALELLLSSPLKVSEIAEGQSLALRRQFLWPVVALLGVDCAFILSGPPGVGNRIEGISAMFPAGMVVLLLDLAALKWVGMWLAISQSNLSRVLLGTLWRVLLLPWLIWFLLFSSVAFFQFVFARPISLSLIQMVAMWTFISVVIDLTVWLTARKRFLRDFRTLATPRFDSPDVLPAFSLRKMLKRIVRPPPAEGTQPRTLKSTLQRHWIAASVVALLVLSTVFLIVYRLTLKAEIRRELQAIQQRGEPVLRSDIDKWYPAVLESENAALQLQPVLGTLFLPGARGGTNQPSIQMVVARNAKALRTAHQAVHLRKSRIDSDWSDPQSGPQWRFWRLHQLGHLLGMEATVHIENGHPAAALESVETIFGLAHTLVNEPLFDPQARRQWLLNQALSDLERVLSQTSLADAQFQQFQKTLAEAEQESLDPNRWVRALIGERFRLIRFHEAISLGTTTLGAGQLPSAELTRLQLLLGIQKLSGVWERNFLRPLRAMGASIEAAKLPLPERLRRAAELEASLGGQMSMQVPGTFQSFVPLLGTGAVREDADIIARLRAAQTAIAIERYRLQHGSPPDELIQLAPVLIEKVPTDPVDGQILKYVRTRKGYLIYTPRNPQPKTSSAATSPNRISSQFTVNK